MQQKKTVGNCWPSGGDSGGYCRAAGSVPQANRGRYVTCLLTCNDEYFVC